MWPACAAPFGIGREERGERREERGERREERGERRQEREAVGDTPRACSMTNA
jgi:hypothetical protein